MRLTHVTPVVALIGCLVMFSPALALAQRGGGSLKFDVKPKNAEVFVDGYLAGRVDNFGGFFQSLGVPAGPHTLTLWCQGYRTVTQEVRVQRGVSLKVEFQMMPLAAGERQDPRPGPPPMSATYRPRSGDVPQPVQPRAPRAPARPRQPAAPPSPAQPPQPAAAAGQSDGSRLAIRVQPGDAQIFIDGEPWHTSPGSERLVVQLSPGVHHVEVRKAGFKDFKTDVETRTGETAALNVALSGQDGQ